MKYPSNNKVFNWIKLASLTAFFQIVIQLLSLLSGILIVRFLSTEEYALYTVANTMMGTLVMLSDGGLSTGLMSEGGKVWDDKGKLGQVMASTMNLRKSFAVVTLVCIIPIFSYLLLHHNAGYVNTILIVISIFPIYYASLSDSFLEVILRLHQDVKPLQKNQLLVAALRFAMTVFGVFFLPFTVIALLSAGLSRIYGNIRLKKLVYRYVDSKQGPQKSTERQIVGIVKKILPGSIYYSISGQLSIFLISIFGSTRAIADMGAIGRITMVLSVFSMVFNILIVPRFARLNDDKSVLLKRINMLLLGLAVILLLAIGVVYLFPDQILWILGEEYQNLKNELFILVINACIGLMASLSYTLNASRGWIINPVLKISINILTIVAGILLFNLSTVTGVVSMSILTISFEFIMYVLLGYIKICRLNKYSTNNKVSSVSIN